MEFAFSFNTLKLIIILYLSDPVCSQHKMVIVYPYKWRFTANVITRVDQLLQRFHGTVGELLVCHNVGIPVLVLEGSPVGHRVEQRPESGIAATIIVAVEHLRINLDRNHLRKIINQYKPKHSRFYQHKHAYAVFSRLPIRYGESSATRGLDQHVYESVIVGIKNHKRRIRILADQNDSRFKTSPY